MPTWRSTGRFKVAPARSSSLAIATALSALGNLLTAPVMLFWNLEEPKDVVLPGETLARAFTPPSVPFPLAHEEEEYNLPPSQDPLLKKNRMTRYR